MPYFRDCWRREPQRKQNVSEKLLWFSWSRQNSADNDQSERYSAMQRTRSSWRSLAPCRSACHRDRVADGCPPRSQVQTHTTSSTCCRQPGSYRPATFNQASNQLVTNTSHSQINGNSLHSFNLDWRRQVLWLDSDVSVTGKGVLKAKFQDWRT